MKRILVPVDGSEFAEAALEPALALAERHGAELHLASVVSSAPPVPMAYADEEIVSHFMEDQKARVREYVEKLSERAGSLFPGVTVTTHVGVGRVSRTVQSIAREIGADLLVLTTHGRGAFQRAWLGSIADQLLRRIENPILLLPRPKEGQGPVDLNAIRHALVPLDGSEAAEGVLDALSLVIQPDSGCRVTLAGVVDDEVSLPGVYLPHLISEEADRKSTRLNSSHSQQSRMPSSA